MALHGEAPPDQVFGGRAVPEHVDAEHVRGRGGILAGFVRNAAICLVVGAALVLATLFILRNQTKAKKA